ncbi:cation transporter [Methylovorus mays]|uniref:cation transporter n=1 Tax=Methylovorus mays TaxID=184077 RepID=UPI001E5D30A9|nr:cation transporter [Methylovorus mays]MCB5206366.1 cation transporter [Methylovorus mays]
MADCCHNTSCAIEALKQRQSKTLKIVLGINAIMFVVVFVAGLLAHSTALLSDSLDNLGDALTYALSLYVVSRSAREKAVVALFKGGLILLAGLFVLGQVIYRLFVPALPLFDTMGGIGVLSLLANSLCLFLLWKHRSDDINMSSVWACSRNDIATNLAVIVAAGAVWLFNAAWPDLVVGLALSVLLISSSAKVLAAAWHALRRAA